MRAKDVMRRHVVVARPWMNLSELARLFIEHRITGAPVADAHGTVLGVVSQTDLVRYQGVSKPQWHAPRYYLDDQDAAVPAGLMTEQDQFVQVSDVMTRVVISADEEATVGEVAKLMLHKRVHRVLITRNGKLSGMVTSMDLLRPLVDLLEGTALPGPR